MNIIPEMSERKKAFIYVFWILGLVWVISRLAEVGDMDIRIVLAPLAIAFFKDIVKFMIGLLVYLLYQTIKPIADKLKKD